MHFSLQIQHKQWFTKKVDKMLIISLQKYFWKTIKNNLSGCILKTEGVFAMWPTGGELFQMEV